MINRLRCGSCHVVIKYKDFVYLDVHHTIIHQKCYTTERTIKDRGTFEEIIHRHQFFDALKAEKDNPFL